MLAEMTRNALLLAFVALAFAGCGVEQAEECARYVACQAAYDEAFGIRPPTPTSDYDADGVCWHGNPATAEQCAAICASTTESLGEAAAAAGRSLDACEG